MTRALNCLLPVSLSAAIALLLVVGCAPGTADKKSPPKDAKQPASGSATKQTKPEDTKKPSTGPELKPQERPQSEPPKGETKIAPKKAAETAKAAAAPTTQPQPEPSKATAKTTGEKAPASDNKVALGTPELTAGIPGDGPLTVEQIRAWLAEPENNEPLAVALPHGLDRAEKHRHPGG